jgi:hypothetical protein
MSASARTHLVRTDVSVLPLGNFITDAIVRPSHGRLSGHGPTVHLSVHPFVRYRPHDNPGSITMNEKWREVDRSWSLGFLTFSVSITLLQRCCTALVCVLVLRLSCFCVALVVLLCCI